MKHYDEENDELCIRQIELAANARSLVPFVGAGLSILCGQPSWEGFAGKTVDKLTKHVRSPINYAHAALFATLSTRNRLSLIDHIAKANDIQRSELFANIFDHSQKSGERINQTQQYADIWRLAKSNLVITTNYDGLLGTDNPADRSATDTGDPVADGSFNADARLSVTARCGIDCDVKMIPERASKAKLLIEWHGSAQQADGMIVTVGDYIRHYAPSSADVTRPPHLEFLSQLFKKKQILFIGYGLAEMEILEYVLQKAVVKDGGSQRGSQQPPHFLVQGYFQHEKELVVHLKRYYSKLNILLLPFSRDEKNYDELLSMIADIAARVDAVATPVVDKLAQMATLVRGKNH